MLTEDQKFSANHELISRALKTPKTPLVTTCEDASGNLYLKRRDPNERWNDVFVNKPTDYEVQIYLMKLDDKNKKNSQYQKNLYNQVIHDECMCCLATLSIDQEYLQVPQLIKEIVSVLRSTAYKWYDEPILRAEFYSGQDGKWNPHIHILNKRGLNNGVAPSVIKQALTKKLKGTKYQVYRVAAHQFPLTAGENYINGIKKQEKQENVEKDAQYRKENNIDDIYYLHQS